MSAAKDQRRIIRQAKAAGAVVEQRRNGHYRIHLPNGLAVTASASPSDLNSHKQLIRDLRRAGLDISGAAA